MGVTDEHWCSRCRKPLDKEKDRYYDVQALNDPNAKSKCNKDTKEDDKVFSSAILCRECLEKDKVTYTDPKTGGVVETTAWAYLARFRRRGNPTFKVLLACQSADKCKDYRNRPNGFVRCAHIAVNPSGILYCKRRHPGKVVVPQEKAVRDQYNIEEFKKRSLSVLRLGLKKNVNLHDVVTALGQDPANLHQPSPLLTGAEFQPPVHGAPIGVDALTMRVQEALKKADGLKHICRIVPESKRCVKLTKKQKEKFKFNKG